MASLSCFIIGDDTLTYQCGQVLLDQGHDLRGLITESGDVARWADERNVRVIDPRGDLVAALADQPFDYLWSIANLRLLSGEVVDLPRLGAINFHDGPLPRYAGVHSTSWAVMNQEREHGVSHAAPLAV